MWRTFSLDRSSFAGASVNGELGLGIASLAAEAVDPLDNVLAGLVQDLAEDHVFAVQPEI